MIFYICKTNTEELQRCLRKVSFYWEKKSGEANTKFRGKDLSRGSVTQHLLGRSFGAAETPRLVSTVYFITSNV